MPHPQGALAPARPGGMKYPKQRVGQPTLPAKPTVPREQNRTNLGLRAFPRAPGNPLLARETKRITGNILLYRFKCDTYTQPGPYFLL